MFDFSIFLNDLVIWFFAGSLLLFVELLTLTFIFLWFSFSAFSVFFCLLFFDIFFTHQIVIFLVVLAFSLFFTWSFLRNSFEKKDRFLNRPVTKLIGSEFILKDEVQDSHYRLDAQGTSWIVRVPLCSTKGDKVRIVGVDGVVLLAELVPAP